MSDALATGDAAALRDLAIQLAREAGEIQRQRYATDLRIETKSAPIDLVTEVDRACEAAVVAGIRAARPQDAILAEEGSCVERPDAELRWIVDPLDGTTNYAHAYPRFCVSIGVERRGEPFLGVVYDPLLDELFAATRGGGASLNGRPIHVSREEQLGRAMLCTGFAYDVQRSAEDNVAQFTAFLKSARAIRRDGSAALDLCYVAAGRFDGFWEFKLAPWDVAAGCLMVEEAGGRATDARGGATHLSGHSVVASNGLLHGAMLEILEGPS